MKAVILAGGMGTRLDEESESKPKPMVEVGGRPILWHIMKHLAWHGIDEFVVALGHRGDVVKRYFTDQSNLAGDMVVDMSEGSIVMRHDPPPEGWKIHLCDTGPHANTAARLWKVRRLVEDAPFLVTYGDGVSDVDIAMLTKAHKLGERLATITAVHPPARFGAITVLPNGRVAEFSEKQREGWINGGYMLFEPGIFEHPVGADVAEQTDLSAGVLAKLAEVGQLTAHRHVGYWQCMDTMREKRLLDALWAKGAAPWKVWP